MVASNLGQTYFGIGNIAQLIIFSLFIASICINCGIKA